MAARNWTPEQRAKQAAIIHGWQPWKLSTGARTPEGKAKVLKNAFRPTQRKHQFFSTWLIRQVSKLRAGKPCATVEEIIRRAKHCGIDI